MYPDLWTGGKCVYKCEPVVEDGGELIVYAPRGHGLLGDRERRRPLTIDPDAWKNREDEGILCVEHAGEILYRCAPRDA